MAAELSIEVARGFDALARALAGGTADDFNALGPIFNSVLPSAAGALGDGSALASAYHRTLELEMHPYARVFMRDDLVTSGEDHVSSIAARIVSGRALVDEELLPWIGALSASMSHNASNRAELLFAQLIDLLRDLALYVGDDRVDAILPDVPRVFDDDDSGLREVAAWLARPAFVGVFLAPRDLTEIARAVDLPTGFGPRQTRLHNLLSGAAHYDVAPATFRALAERIGAKARRFEQMRGARDEPALSRFAERAKDAVESLDRAAQLAGGTRP